MYKENIYAVIVTYNPCIISLQNAIDSLQQQCHVVIVDNSENSFTGKKLVEGLSDKKCTVIVNSNNVGIAKAQNIGIIYAMQCNAIDILLLDDDSIPSSGLVENLITARLSKSSMSIITSRAVSIDGVELNNARILCKDILTPCQYLNSSGSLIPVLAFKIIGLFDESLFIDCVDYEWGWRAQSKGYSLYISRDAKIFHSLGESTRFKIKIPSPIRHYYQHRNILFLIFKVAHTPMYWRTIQPIKMIIKDILILIIADQPVIRIKYMLFGIRDFLQGKYGRIET